MKSNFTLHLMPRQLIQFGKSYFDRRCDWIMTMSFRDFTNVGATLDVGYTLPKDKNIAKYVYPHNIHSNVILDIYI